MPSAVPRVAARGSAASGAEKCGRCGAAFTCGAVTKSAACWCFSMPRLENADLSGTCLCCACLAASLTVQQVKEI